jgi:hypothetical protein
MSSSCQQDDTKENLSVRGRKLITMNTSTKTRSEYLTRDERSRRVFEDPVAYLASFGIEAVVVSETTTLPAAA